VQLLIGLCAHRIEQVRPVYMTSPIARPTNKADPILLVLHFMKLFFTVTAKIIKEKKELLVLHSPPFSIQACFKALTL
jgi:hypothetical protein